MTTGREAPTAPDPALTDLTQPDAPFRSYVAWLGGGWKALTVYDEEEVTRRLRVLREAAAGDPDYETAVAEVIAFHNERRAAQWAEQQGRGEEAHR